MKIIKLTMNPFSMNCYIYYDEQTGTGIIIDPAAFTDSEKNKILTVIKEKNIDIKYIINTHGHIDHILGNSFAKENFKVPILMHRDDLFLLKNANEQAKYFGLDFPEPPPIDEYISENTLIKLNGTQLKFIHTPGHSPGSVCIIDDKNKNVFCGDLIFKNSVGRTDLEGGDMNVLVDSIKNKLFKSTANDYTMYPGHMETTNVRDEKKLNPFLNG